jgi:hypothetical protein
MNNITWDFVKEWVACVSHFSTPILFPMTSLLFGLTWLFSVHNCTTTSRISRDNVSILFDFPQIAHNALLVHNAKDILLTTPSVRFQ